MELWLQAAISLALLSFSALCIYAILTLKDVRGALRLVQTISQSLEKLPQELKELRVRLLGTLQNLEETTKNSALITQKINHDLNSSGGIFAEIEALAGQLRKLREFLQTGIIQPLGSIAVTVSALSKGSEAFSEALRKPRNVQPPRTDR